MALEDNYQFETAISLIKAGLESGSIKLVGPFNTLQAKANCAADAAYLTGLIEELVKVLPERSTFT